MKHDHADLFNLVETIFAKSTQRKYLDHTQRVLSHARQIGEAEGANLRILIPAVMLHDIGMTVDASFEGHPQKSMLLSSCILPTLNYSEAETKDIVRIVGSHHPKPGTNLSNLEECVLFDADNLDIIGVLGVLRWVGAFPNSTKELEKQVDLFLNIVDQSVQVRGSLFHTNSAKKIGTGCLNWTVDYFKTLKMQIRESESGQVSLPLIPRR